MSTVSGSLPGAAFALGMRLVRALDHCGDRESALRTLADVLARGIDAPVVVWQTLADGSTVHLVGDRGLSRHQHDRIRCDAALRSLGAGDRSDARWALADALRGTLGATDLTVLDIGYGIVVLGRRVGDAADVSGEIRAALDALPGSVAAPSVPGVGARPASGDRDAERLRSLSAREREILALIAEGNGTNEIANRLSISGKTVKTHVQHLLGKLGVRTRLEAAALAHRARANA